MKFIKTLSYTALTTLTIMHTVSYTTPTSCHKDQETAAHIIKFCGSMIMCYEPWISQFFNDKSDIRYNEIETKITPKREEHQKKINNIVPAGVLSTKAYVILKEVFNNFCAAFDVIHQYKEKSPDTILNFVADINKVFSPEAAFTSIATKLQLLQKEAINSDAQELVTIIDSMLQMIQQKKAEWGKKKYVTLIAGLKKRMSTNKNC